MPDIKLICFDLDDTLWSTKQVMMEAEKQAFTLLSQNATVIAEHYDMMSLFQARVKKWKQLTASHPQLKYQISQLRRQSLSLVLQDHNFSQSGADQLSDEIFQCFMHWRHKPIYFEHAEETLAQLSEQYQLAAITNGNACSKRLGLDKYFTLHISAEDLGIGKPEPEPFVHTLKHFNVKAEEALHIGDNPSDDVLGARQAGLYTIWYNPKSNPWKEADYKASLEVDQLNKIPAAVERLQANLQMKP
ncbi:HAD family hydrolase [uncultured Pseudoteredinibacter sp.]|uniref:HAD family hydrolase n=1 Tax=uncultured Pseudoteredinibacter sp. TaxID=1641701 RepID=UPI00261363A3|nr:HAD family hydrolase [uncultured Pseudoteredinibacter sp.]